MGGLLLSSCASKDLYEITIEGHIFQVEVADTPGEWRRGLMDRTKLGKDRGMLFIFPEDRRLSFWMKDTPLPLSIAYIDSSGIIREIHAMEPHSRKAVSSKSSLRYALEVNRGRFAELGIAEGGRIVFWRGFEELLRE